MGKKISKKLNYLALEILGSSKPQEYTSYGNERSAWQ